MHFCIRSSRQFCLLLRRVMRIPTTLDPESPFVHKWNTLVLISCLIAVCVDPLLCYSPVVEASRFCLFLDKQVAVTFCFLRTLVDALYLLHILLQLRTGFFSPVLGGGELVTDFRFIALRYLQSYLLMDVVSILPSPQIETVVALIQAETSRPFRIRPLTFFSVFQNIVRMARIVPLFIKVTRSSAISTAWSGAASNFLLYIIASHVVGSLWYLMSVERVDKCWRLACENNQGCNFDDLYCGSGHHHQPDKSFLVSSCYPSQRTDSILDYGIFFDALRIQLYQRFFQRFYYCFVWGLRNLSSLGQNLETSTGIGENLFVVVISITGLILFSFLAGNIQRYLQSLTARGDAMRLKLRDQEQWMSRDMLPQDLRMRVRQHEQMKWQKMRGVDKESLIQNLPKDLRMDIKRHQCLSLLKRVPVFEKLDRMVLDALCCRLKPVLYDADSCILCEGEPVDEMLLIKKGDVLNVTRTGSGIGRNSLNMVILKAGDLFGEELLMWALHPNSSSTPLPISTKTFKAINDVEAFSLLPDHLKCVLAQFRYRRTDLLYHIRFCSEEWRLWGACTIQATWRQYYKRKMGRSLIHPKYSFPKLLPQKPAD